MDIVTKSSLHSIPWMFHEAKTIVTRTFLLITCCLSLSLSLSISLTLCLQRLSGLAFSNFIFVFSVRVGGDIYLTICSLHDIYYTLLQPSIHEPSNPFPRKPISFSPSHTENKKTAHRGGFR